MHGMHVDQRCHISSVLIKKDYQAYNEATMTPAKTSQSGPSSSESVASPVPLIAQAAAQSPMTEAPFRDAEYYFEDHLSVFLVSEPPFFLRHSGLLSF